VQRFGDATPRYNIFGELANLIKINQDRYNKEDPAAAAYFEEIKRQEQLEPEEPLESLPNLQPLQLSQISQAFVTRVGPLVDMWDYFYHFMTFKDTRDTMTFLCVMTYVIIYQETVCCLLPLAPLGMIMFIFYNYFYEVKFKRPR
jgi:hypothetical protein